MDEIIKAEHLNLWYGTNHALKDINISVQKNNITALIGPSGCGKSTVTKIVSGLYHAWDGSIKFDGVDISGKALSKAIIENGIGLESMGRKQDTLEDFFFQLTEEEK